MADTVKFPANLPVELALKFDTGLECQSQFNNQDQVCYTLADRARVSAIAGALQGAWCGIDGRTGA